MSLAGMNMSLDIVQLFGKLDTSAWQNSLAE